MSHPGEDRTKKQLREWEGKFGDDYTDRNVVAWLTRLPLFQAMLEGLNLPRVLEVGCNRGHNLVALSELLGPGAEIVGVEPNPHARNLARSASSRTPILAGDAYDLPFKEGTFDLVFTWGVLIHVPLDSLRAAMAEIHRVSARYLLAIEYFAEQETRIAYRGHDDLLWKRNFLKHYQAWFPDLSLVRQGSWGPEQRADNVSWWLLSRRTSSQDKEERRAP